MYITPEIVAGEATVFLVYTSEGKGHYDAAIAAHKQETSQPPVLQDAGVGLTRNAFYSARCKCFKLSKLCTSECNSVGCANPFGRRSLLKVG